ncbi:MAG: ABC transporter permease [Bacilli bacterium]
MNKYNKYLKKLKKDKLRVLCIQFSILIGIIIIHELLYRFDIINSFIFSSPSKMLNTIINLHTLNNLYNHIWITVKEILIGFSLSFIIGLALASILWSSKTLYKILDPFITVFASLPKVALGPLLIIIFGAGTNSIIIMTLLISTVITMSYIYNAFISTNANSIKLLHSINANKLQIYYYGILRNNMTSIIGVLKVNISMTLIGVIMGEFLASKEGIGYLIMYGSNIFNLDLVMASILILIIISGLLYYLVVYFEKKILKE